MDSQDQDPQDATCRLRFLFLLADPPPPPLLLLPLLLLAVRWILNFRQHKMRQLGIIPLGRILIIEAKAEQIFTNTFFVLQLQNARQNVVCGRGFPVVGKTVDDGTGSTSILY